jgi:Cu+-exporting ATPase
MALEPETVTAEAPPNHELTDFTRRFWVGLVLALPVLALEMGGHLTNLHMLIPGQMSNWIQCALPISRLSSCGVACPSSSVAGHRFAPAG